MKKFPTWLKNDAIGITLLIAFLLGTIWIVLIAPWEHHDEPNHFQYLRLISDRGSIPEQGIEDWHLNRQILKSMIWNGFFTRLGSEPALPPPKQPIYLPGYPQYTEPPAYYIFASIFVNLAKSQNITRQLIAGRVASLVLYLLTIIAGWGITRELTKSNHPLRWMVPVTIALIPGFVDVMTALNNDAGAVVVMSYFLWASVRLIRRGFKWLEFFWALDLAVLGWLTKSSSTIAIPLFAVVMIFTIFRAKLRWVAWAIIGAAVIVLSFVVFQRQDAAYFYRSTSQSLPTQAENPNAVAGTHALQIESEAPITPSWMPSIFQPIPLELVGPRMGEVVTLGVWMWANHPVHVETPRLVTEAASSSYMVDLTENPTFYTVQATLDDDTARFWVNLDPKTDLGEQTIIYYDGMVLAEGERPADSPPIYDDSTAISGVWGEQPFDNFLRNGSFESTGIRIAPWLDNALAHFLPDQIRPSLVMTSLLDRAGSGWYYAIAFSRIFRSFWGYFGWAHIALNPIIYGILGFITIIGSLGACLAGLRRLKTAPWDIIFFFGLSMSLTWIAMISRGVIYLTFANMFFPVARYAAPVIIPVALLLTCGWLEIAQPGYSYISKLIKKKSLPRVETFSWTLYVIYLIPWLILDAISIFSIIQYYR
jgi:hypothetical protein